MAHSFHISPTNRHLKWSQSLTPALTVPSGAEVTFDLLDGGHNQIRPDNEVTALRDFDFSMTDPAFGPVYVEGAEPGDVLRVDFLDLRPGAYGWTALLPGFGLLADDPEFAAATPQLKIWDLTEAGTVARPRGSSKKRLAVLKPGVAVPIRPFLGVCGVAPAQAGAELSTIPPYAGSGGNMDCRDLSTVGATLYLPVNVPGALFSCGDGHAAQGDGEVCGTAIETPMTARLRLTVEKAAEREARGWRDGRGLGCPHYVTAPKGREEIEDEVESDKGEYAALGIHEDIREASKMAVRGVIDWLESEKGLSRVEGYMLCSVASKLRMSEVVDMPNYAVSCALPLSVFLD
ncbi:Formamidase [Coniochaeta hoffmannii]|uniref:Formamidase n=1 Tax=Coniochaeta hoffmannii TaxID=91930 RepID=A0AA38VM65_9PEZI|nr:Formamidase [Coniochaeta hoffmannii]